MTKLGVWEKRGTEDAVECVLVEKSDYDGGDPDLSLTRRSDNSYDFVVYRGTKDLCVHDLSAKQVRTAALHILNLVPEPQDADLCV